MPWNWMYTNSSSDAPKSAPTVAIVPFDRDVARADFVPPGGEFRARDVERSRRHQMIEDDRVLLSPAKSGNRAQVIVVEEMLSQRPAARCAIQRTINQLRGGEHDRRRSFRQVQQRAPVHARSQT